MRWRLLNVLLGFLTIGHLIAQPRSSQFPHLDSLAKKNGIPGLIWIRMETDSVPQILYWGKTRLAHGEVIGPKHLFRLGSVTKTLTALLIAEAVKSGQLKWEDRFLDYCPEFRKLCEPAYADLRLLDLVDMQTSLPSWTYTWPEPQSFSGSADSQRVQFIRWCLSQPPPSTPHKGFRFTNPAYVMAARMLEKASHKPYRELVSDWAKKTGLNLQFGAPNQMDSNQVWGHFEDGAGESPGENPRLEWLEPAGNLSMDAHSVAEYLRIWLGLLNNGRSGKGAESWQKMLHRNNPFSMGWFSKWDENGAPIYWHVGNPGSFYCKVVLKPGSGKAVAVLVNRQSKEVEAFVNQIVDWE